MDYNKFQGFISASVSHSMRVQLNNLIKNNAELKFSAELELSNYMIFFRKHTNQIFTYLKNDENKKNYTLRAGGGNFIFHFIVFTDLSCKIEIHHLHKIETKINISHLIDKAKNIHGYVYFLKSEYGYKIGNTAQLKKRMNTFGVLLPFKTELHSFVSCKKHVKLEADLHKYLDHKRTNGEWFNLIDEDFIELDIFLKNQKLERTLETIIN